MVLVLGVVILFTIMDVIAKYLARDYPVIQGVTLLFAFLYVLINLGIDVAYTLLDPRIRY